MKRIPKIDTRSQTTSYGSSALVLALPFVAVGTYLALAGFGRLPLPGKVHAPLQVVGFIGLAFAGSGSMLGLHATRSLLRRRRVAERRGREPWFVDHAWDPRGVSDGVGERIASQLAGLALFAVFLVPFNWVAFGSGEGRWFVRAIVGLFDLFLLLGAGTVLYRLLQAVKYRGSRLLFRRFPFHPGEELLVGFRGRVCGPIRATLRFVEERFERRGSGSNRSVQLVVYEHVALTRSFQCAGSGAPVELTFEIPDDGGLVTALSGKPVRYWELLVESPQPGVDFRTTFPLPVYPRC